MKKSIIVFVIIILFISLFSISFGQENKNSEIKYSIGKVTAKSLKIRSGIGTENSSIGLLSKGDTVHVYDKIQDWYIIKTENNLVGAVFAEYIELSYDEFNTIETSANVESANEISNTLLSQNEQIFFNLINNKRMENNLPKFEIDETLFNIARLKAQDIVNNKYFSHTSPTYGTIFEMLQNNNISYSKASENISRNLNADDAVKSLMNSESHKNNILSKDFNYTGIAVVDSINWGKVFVEIFVAK